MILGLSLSGLLISGICVRSVMKQQRLFWLICLFIMFFNSCAVPRVLWPQKDLPHSESMGKPGGPMVLMASRDSEFKRALVREIGYALVSEGINQRTIGVDDLKGIKSSEYNVVVVISSCIAWGLEEDVQVFLKSQENYSNIILVTTSGNGGWLPNTLDKDVDAISSASTLSTVNAIARNVMTQISSRLQ